MLSVFDGLRSVTTLSVFVRLACAFICGGIIGIERSYKRRPAGFRTHILICIGAAITTLTSQYLYLNMHYFTDMARLGAQVVAGIGFIGAGTIIVTKRQNVKGLTTAAGLWTSAIMVWRSAAAFMRAAFWLPALLCWQSRCSRGWSTVCWSTFPRSMCIWNTRIKRVWTMCCSCTADVMSKC
mgnify:FL=1